MTTNILKKNLLLTIGFAMITSSCGIGMPIMTPAQRQVLVDINSLKEENQEIKETLTGNASEIRATLVADMDTLREEFSFIKGESEENKRLLEELRTSSEDIEAKIISIETTLTELSDKVALGSTSTSETLEMLTKDVAELKVISEKVNDRLVTVEKRASTKVKKDKEKAKGPKTMYNEAYSYINKKKHKTAIKKMREFLKVYPTHSLADNALYWIGEIHYADGEWDKAILEFENVQVNYPKGDKTPAALLKQGYAFDQLGEKETAIIVLQKVIAKYPKSSEAEKAQRKLKKLK